ncbi:alpha/beta hydrolase [Spirosoma endbachense]|uniref:Prolyl oligopeptidase family serine peptidase n=1 Tax=Spirosoma endbachense TaxID=2666025 RepID=A0A6P1VTS4_9BACT|nr:alpha/beta fold hydrolase [Spirosoma endbachense]QHV95808.1 prolyl oligopeptidase family serine peptidase [Spirosoma endbachense]
MNRQKSKRRTLWALAFGFILVNIVAFFHAYKFTHFADTEGKITESPDKLSVIDKIEPLLFGINNPRPKNKMKPTQPFETVKLQSNKAIGCWHIKADSAKGTIILFHGYAGDKSRMLDKSDEFIKQGYNTFLVDFMGSGESEGNQTTIGFKEAEEVKTAFDYLVRNGEKRIYLFGTSQGAVAILKALYDYPLSPKGIILECPFGSMYQTTCARFTVMKVPSFPMAGLLVFWGGFQNDFWAFGHNPTDYATRVKCPTLLLYGEQDKNVSRQEIDAIYKNLTGKKELITYPLAGHENFLKQYKQAWIRDTQHFLQTIGK